MINEEGSRKMALMLAAISRMKRKASERERMMRKEKKNSSKTKTRSAE